MRPFALLLGSALLFSLAITPVEAAKKRASVKLVNKSAWALHHLFLSPTDEIDWGPDQLGKATVEPGRTFTLTDIECSSYDVKLVDEDGDECVVEDIDLCGNDAVWTLTSDALLQCQGFGHPAAAAQGGSRRRASVRIVNTSQFQLHHLFLSSSDANSWGPDQLGDEVIGRGDAFTLTDIECDRYDIKVVDEDGDTCVLDNEDLCGDNAIWHITDKELLACEGYQD